MAKIKPRRPTRTPLFRYSHRSGAGHQRLSITPTKGITQGARKRANATVAAAAAWLAPALERIMGVTLDSIPYEAVAAKGKSAMCRACLIACVSSRW